MSEGTPWLRPGDSAVSWTARQICQQFTPPATTRTSSLAQNNLPSNLACRNPSSVIACHASPGLRQIDSTPQTARHQIIWPCAEEKLAPCWYVSKAWRQVLTSLPVDQGLLIKNCRKLSNHSLVMAEAGEKPLSDQACMEIGQQSTTVHASYAYTLRRSGQLYCQCAGNMLNGQPVITKCIWRKDV